MNEKAKKDELETCKAILGTKFSNVLILVETPEGWIADYNSECAAYGLAAKFIQRCDNPPEDDVD